LVHFKYALKFGTITNVDFLESVLLTFTYLDQRFEISRVSQVVNVDDAVFGVGNNVANDSRPNEPGATCYENFH
jgi:hypothetical protein